MNTKKVISVMIVLVMFLTGASIAMAFGPGQCRRGHGMELRPMCLKTMIELNLSDAQKAQLLGIINKYEEEGKTAKQGLREANKKFRELMHAEKFDEKAVREAFRKVSSAREDLMIRRAKIRAEIKGILTPQQIELLKEKKAQRREMMKERMGGPRGMRGAGW